MIRTFRLLACTITVFSGTLSAADPRPNILFIFSDDHSSNAIGT